MLGRVCSRAPIDLLPRPANLETRPRTAPALGGQPDGGSGAISPTGRGPKTPITNPRHPVRGGRGPARPVAITPTGVMENGAPKFLDPATPPRDVVIRNHVSISVCKTAAEEAMKGKSFAH